MPAVLSSGSSGSSSKQQPWRPGKGIAQDFAGRLIPHYRSDWLQGLNWGSRILPPSSYIFFASVLPALAFGQQLATDTEGTLTVVHVLVATALSGIVQAVLGGQPLLIIGVAEPIVIIYSFLYSFAKTAPGLGVSLFLPWAAWVCVWTSLMCGVLAVVGASEGIKYFTRFSGELFGALIAILFLQVGIKGIVHEFYPLETPAAPATPEQQWQLTLINGLWSLLLSLGLLLTCLHILHARAWRLGRSWLRGFLADYGVPLMVLVWSGLSFAVTPADGVPRRVATPNTWEVRDTWGVAGRMGEVPGPYIAAALLPAFIISVLFYFDHNVSSQMAQQPEFNLVKGPAYHWDFLLLSGLTLVCGLIGLPPVNGVLPQAPMHTRSLAHIRKQPQQSTCQPQLAPGGGAVALGAMGNAADGADVVCRVHGSSDISEAEETWLVDAGCVADSVAAAATAADDAISVEAVTGPLSQLQLGGSTSGSRSLHSRQQQVTAGHPSCVDDGQYHQQQDGVQGLAVSLQQMTLQTQTFKDPAIHRLVPTSVVSTSARLASAAGGSTTGAYDSRSGSGLPPRHKHGSMLTSHLDPSRSRQEDAVAARPSSISQQQLRQRGHVLELQQLQEQQQQQQEQQQLHHSRSDAAINMLPDSAGPECGADGVKGGPDKWQHGHDTYLKLEVREQRVSNLLQSLLVAACLGITPAIQQIPTGVLWGYFIFMAVKSLEGSQLWERLLLLLTDPRKRVAVLQQEHAAYMQLVPYRVTVRFTLLQLVYLLGVWALTTWAGIAGVAFPLPIMALVPLRQFVLPRLFDPAHLSQLDAAEYEEAPAVIDRRAAVQELYDLGAITEAPAPHLPTAAPGADNVLDELWGEEEAEVVSREFRGLQLKHHMTRDSLRQQQQ